MDKRLFVLKILLLSIAVVNGLLGIVAFLSQGEFALKVGSLFYGTTLSSLTPQIDYLIKWLGCSFLGVAVFAALAIKDPVRNQAVIYGNIAWLVFRGLQRVIYFNSIHEAFGISYARIWGNAIFVFIIALLLFLFRPRTNASSK